MRLKSPRLPAAASLALLALVLSCATAPQLSPEVLGQVNRQVGMNELAADPQANVGQVVLLGGRIIKTENLPQATEIEVLQSPLDGDDRPEGGDVSQGRFLVLMPGYADPAIYAPGRLITVAGRVKGASPRPVGQLDYNYPVLDVLQVQLWQEGGQRNGYPNVFFSIGVGTIF